MAVDTLARSEAARERLMGEGGLEPTTQPIREHTFPNAPPLPERPAGGVDGLKVVGVQAAGGLPVGAHARERLRALHRAERVGFRLRAPAQRGGRPAGHPARRGREHGQHERRHERRSGRPATRWPTYV